jgi:hypothetical protein
MLEQRPFGQPIIPLQQNDNESCAPLHRLEIAKWDLPDYKFHQCDMNSAMPVVLTPFTQCPSTAA